jgi:Protein of unknown function (DUF2758).|nr:MAG TPA: Sporulation protein Cse60 [Caudoviricetes sp.]
MRVEIFGQETKRELEDEINEFIKDKEVIDIKFSTVKRNLGYYYTVCILYKY